MTCHSIIPVYDLFGSSINSRESSAVLIEIITHEPCDYIELDFSGVISISRAFADQFHIEKLHCLEKLHKKIIFINASDAILNMFHAVVKSHQGIRKKVNTVPIYKYSTIGQVEEYLLSF